MKVVAKIFRKQYVFVEEELIPSAVQPTPETASWGCVTGSKASGGLTLIQFFSFGDKIVLLIL